MWFKNKQTKRKVTVVGCGKLGLPLVAVLSEAGHQVVGFDSNTALIASLSTGKVPWFEESLQSMLRKNSRQIRFTSDAKEAFADAEFVLVIVPSPSKTSGEFDSQYVESAVTSVVRESEDNQKKRIHIVIVSTLMPGSTEQIIEKLKTTYPSKASNFELIYSPEFIALGTVVKDMTFPDLVLVGASDQQAAQEYSDLVHSYIKSKPHVAMLSIKEAEIAKIAVNSYVTTKISFANFISELCEASGNASASKVLNSIGMDSRIGRKYLKPGAPFGGPCFPRDNIALETYANTVGVSASIANSTRVINQRQSQRIVNFVKRFSELKHVTLVGVAYKPGTAVTEESPSLSIVDLLSTDFDISLVDDYVFTDGREESRQVISRETIGDKPRCVVLMVPDPKYRDIPALLHGESMIIDLWGDWEKIITQPSIKYFRLGDN
jgi:UDPglucose 6-dehydrogenase